jgi:hypothetical protein
MTKIEFKSLITFYIRNESKMLSDFRNLDNEYIKKNKLTNFGILFTGTTILSFFILFPVLINYEDISFSDLFLRKILGLSFLGVIVSVFMSGLYALIENLISIKYTNGQYSFLKIFKKESQVDFTKSFKNIRKIIKSSNNPFLKIKTFNSFNFGNSFKYRNYIENCSYLKDQNGLLSNILKVYKKKNKETYLSDLADVMLENTDIDGNAKNLVMGVLKKGYLQENKNLEEKKIIAELSKNVKKSDMLSIIDEKIKNNKKKNSIVLSF